MDVAVSTGEAVASAAATVTASLVAGTTKGSAVPGFGNIAGAIVGLAVGLYLAYVDGKDWNGNGKSLRDDIKDNVYGWISGGNDEKE